METQNYSCKKCGLTVSSICSKCDRVAINRATMTKFGFKVAELTVVFVKD